MMNIILQGNLTKDATISNHSWEPRRQVIKRLISRERQVALLGPESAELTAVKAHRGETLTTFQDPPISS